MTPIYHFKKLFKDCQRMKVVIVILILTICPGLQHNLLYGQKHVAINLVDYKNNGATPLPGYLSVPYDGTLIPDFVTVDFGGPKNILREGATNVPPDLLDWIFFRGNQDGGNYKMEFFIANGKCVPNPTAPLQDDCATYCKDNVPGYSTATIRKCHQFSGTVMGTSLDGKLCIFGPAEMTMTTTGPASTQGNNGQPVSLNFSNGRNEETYTWALDEGPQPFFTLDDMTGKDAKITFNAPLTDMPEQTFHITVKNDIQSCDKEAKFTFKVSSKGDKIFTGGPVDIVLVVDISGSMGSKAECACKGQQGCPDPPNKTKLRYLKEQLAQLFSMMKNLARPTDKVGLVSFESTSKIEEALTAFSASTIPTKVEAWPDDGLGSTAMGSGLKDAVSLLQPPDPARKRYIILMTNGMQNENPELEWTNPQNKTTVKVGSITFNADLQIKVIPIAIFTPTGDYRGKLNALGTQTGVAVVKDICESNFSLQQAYLDAAKSIGSPKLITFKRDVFSGNTTTGTFTIDENLDKLLVSIINVGNQNFTSFKLEKNISGAWTDITGLGTILPAMAQPSIRRLFTMNFPASLGATPVTTQGDYRYTVISNTPNIPYEFSVMVDDKGVKHSVYTGREYNQTGEPINLTASVFFNGTEVTNANVVVSLESPIASLSSNLSKANIQGVEVKKVPLSERSKKGGFGSPYIKQFSIKNAGIDAMGVDGSRMSNADKKYFVLRNEKGFGTVFEARGNTVPLVHAGNGIYKGQFTATPHVGLYTMHFLITGNVPGIGNITRMDSRDVFVNFGKPVLDKSNLYVMWEEPILLSFTPKDANDNLLGPGQADQISIYISKGGASAPHDYLDGRYVVKLSGINSDDDPDIIIRINRDILYNGKLSGLSRKRWFVTIQGGYDYPQGSFANEFKSNFMGELKLGYRAWKKLGLQAHLGYYSFKNKSASANQSVFGGGLGAFYRFPITNSQGWNIVAEVNGGYYNPKNGSGGFGFNEGIGLNAFINYRLSLVVEARYFTINANPTNINFMSSTIGLKFHF